MILSAQSIRERGIFEPFCERTQHKTGFSFGLSAAGYDVRYDGFILGITDSVMYIDPGTFELASTLEHFTMPNDVLGVVHDKSTWARRGLAVQNTVIEPGWNGYLTLELTNHSDQMIVVQSGTPIAQIVLHQLDAPSEQPYNGKYQGQPRGPQDAIV